MVFESLPLNRGHNEVHSDRSTIVVKGKSLIHIHIVFRAYIVHHGKCYRCSYTYLREEFAR